MHNASMHRFHLISTHLSDLSCPHAAPAILAIITLIGRKSRSYTALRDTMRHLILIDDTGTLAGPATDLHRNSTLAIDYLRRIPCARLTTTSRPISAPSYFAEAVRRDVSLTCATAHLSARVSPSPDPYPSRPTPLSRRCTSRSRQSEPVNIHPFTLP